MSFTQKQQQNQGGDQQALTTSPAPAAFRSYKQVVAAAPTPNATTPVFISHDAAASASGQPKPAMQQRPVVCSDAFDLSSYDPLQDHALQLTASAGLVQIPMGQVVAPTTPQPAPAPPAPNTFVQQAPPALQGSGNQTYYLPQAQQQPQQPQQPLALQQQPAQQQQPVQNRMYQTIQQVQVLPAQQQHQQQPAPLQGQHQQPLPAQPQPLAPSPMTAVQTLFSTATGAPIKVQLQQPPGTFQSQTSFQVNAPQHTQAVTSLIPNLGFTVSSGTKRPNPGEAIVPAQKKQHLLFPGAQAPSAPTETPAQSIQDLSEVDPAQRKPPPNFATMSAEEKRRYERNIREQQRSFKISQQIKELRNLLAESNIPFKPNKFSILLSVVEYIKQLQSRAILLDAEHRKLVTTIKQTSELVNSGQTPEEDTKEVGNDTDMLFVQGLDYKSVFEQCSAALSVAALDGRIIACNDEFAVMSGVSRQQLLRQSVFNLMQNHEEVFKAMGAMLSTSDDPTAKKETEAIPMYWSGVVSQKEQNLLMNITLTRNEEGLPKFFNCALAST